MTRIASRLRDFFAPPRHSTKEPWIMKHIDNYIERERVNAMLDAALKKHETVLHEMEVRK